MKHASTTSDGARHIEAFIDALAQRHRRLSRLTLLTRAALVVALIWVAAFGAWFLVARESTAAQTMLVAAALGASIGAAVLVWRQQGRPPPTPSEGSQGVQNRLVLYRAGNQVPLRRGALEAFEHACDATNGEVIGFGTAAGEHDFGGIAIDQRADRRSRVIEDRFRLLAEIMHARSVTEHFCRNPCYSGRCRWRNRRSCVVVKVDTHGESFIVALDANPR